MNTVVRTKVEINPANARNISGLDDLARIVFPDNRDHRLVFAAIWLELKYTDEHFLPSFAFIRQKYGCSGRVLEIVRARIKKMGLLKQISHFNPQHGYSAGWTFSKQFTGALTKLAEATENLKYPTGREVDEQKDRDAIHYV